MTHTYQISGMHCGSCILKVKNELLKVDDITEANIQLTTPQAIISMQKHIPVSLLQEAVAKAGSFSLNKIEEQPKSENVPGEMKSWIATYKPLLLIFVFITGIATITSFHHGWFDTMHWMHTFMGGFFVAFSFFKLLDLRGFADSYSSYDLLAKKVYAYGFIYPFIELGLGIAYIISWQIFFTSIATIIVMGFSSIGVIQSVINKRKIRCACLGAVFNLPMSTVTIIEDLLMVAMSGMMLAGIV